MPGWYLASPHTVPVDIWVLNQNSSFSVFGLALRGSLHKYEGMGGRGGKVVVEPGQTTLLIAGPQADRGLH